MGENANLGASRPTPPRPVRAVPPYHTGKVQIGIAYVSRQRPDHDRDALRLQDALIASRWRSDEEVLRDLQRERLMTSALACIGAAICAALFFGWI